MKHAFILILIFASLSVKAQTEKGTLLLGGSGSFQVVTEGGVILNLNPAFGVFVKDNLAIGGSLSFITDFEGTTGLGAGAFIKPYFGKKEKGRFFLNVGASYLHFTDDPDAFIAFTAGAGYAFFLNKSIALELGLHYVEQIESSGIISLGTGFNIHWKRNKKKLAAD